MRNIIVCLLVLTVSASAFSKILNFEDFVSKYGKHYTPEEYAHRLNVYKQNLQTIELFNADDSSSFKLGINEFADWTSSEFQQKMLNPQPPRANKFVPDSKPSTTAPPASLDWRNSTDVVVVGPVQNSGDCGGSLIRPVIDSVSSDYSVSYGEDFWLFNTSYVTDCDGWGCTGGFVEDVWKYVTKYGLWWYYDGVCPVNPGVGICISGGVTYIQSGNEATLQEAVARVGPVVVLIDASRPSFQLYTSGVYADAGCSSNNLDHALLLVGYGSSNGVDYWIARNDWGTSWGQKGYIYIARNKNNMCGIASYASYATKAGNCVCSIEA